MTHQLLRVLFPPLKREVLEEKSTVHGDGFEVSDLEYVYGQSPVGSFMLIKKNEKLTVKLAVV